MNKYIMIPVEQYERYKAFMRSNNENAKLLENKFKSDSTNPSQIMSVKEPDDFIEQVASDKDYKRDFSDEKSFINEKNSKILPPPGLPESKVIQKIQNGQQRGEGGRRKGRKPVWLQEWQRKF